MAENKSCMKNKMVIINKKLTAKQVKQERSSLYIIDYQNK